MSDCSKPGCGDPVKTRRLCESHYRQKIRMGVYGYRDVARLQTHVAALRFLGWTWEGIAQAAGLSNHVARLIHLGQTQQVWPETERALLAVPAVPFGSHRGIDSTGTRRRVQALGWMGWSYAVVAERAGTTEKTLATLIRPTRQISYALAARVAAVYDELCMTQGPSNITAGRARGAGHAPPLAWDEHTIDDPAANPDYGDEVPRTVALAENAEELVHGQGYTLAQAAARLGVKKAALEHARKRAELKIGEAACASS